MAAIAIGLGVVAKGPIAAYPLLFLIGLVAVDRCWNRLRQFVFSGAPLTVLVIALPWFIYASFHPAYQILLADLQNSARGGKGHWDLPHVYINYLLAALLPWSGLAALSYWAAAKRWRRDARLRILLVWSLVVFVPLLVWGNKQRHYLLPLMPPTAMILGWGIDRALRRPSNIRGFRGVWRTTVVAYATLIFAAPAIGLAARGSVSTEDAILSIIVLVTVVLAFRAMKVSEKRGLIVFASCNVAVLWFSTCFWTQSLKPVGTHSVAMAIEREFGNAPICF